ncbi:MAG: 4-hydroxybenzoate octaprenyltransferase [Halofilum sp. (in: g-proteobacteria)]|nr:4-hydroxybenzoate octaprenyltransferase [Halofilum sp. (in: g-proteobacteria)]
MTLRARLDAFHQHPTTRRIRARGWQYALLTRIDRPIGTYLLLWPTLWSLWLAAEGVPDPYVLVVFVLGTFCMRAAGCAINDFADRGIDAHVRRTAGRPLATGAIRPWEALTVAAVLALVAFGLVLTLNRLTVYLAIVGVALAALYPFTKRYTHLPQVFLGLAFSWAVPMAFAAQTGTVPPLAWLVFTVNLIWTVGYDTIYAMADKPDDLEIGVKSSAILFGDFDRHMVGLLQLMTLFGLVLIGARAELGLGWYLGVAAAALLFAYQQFLINDRAPAHCFRAFLNNAWVGLVVFIGLALDYALA